MDGSGWVRRESRAAAATRAAREKYESIYSAKRTGGMSREDARAAAKRESGYDPDAAIDTGGGGGGAGGAAGGGDIQSMQDDFPRVVAQLRRTVEDAAATARQQLVAITEGSPSSQAVKDAALEWADAFAAHASKADEINGLSRQVDALGYEAQERYGNDPHAGAWMGRG